MKELLEDNLVFRQIAWTVMNLRQEQYLTQTELGEKVGLSRYQISRIEQGRGDTTLENLNILALYFEIPLEDLFKKEIRTDIEIKLRTDQIEKSSKGQVTRTYSREIPKCAKIRSVEIPFQALRRIQIEDGFTYEFCVLAGNVMIRTVDDMSLMSEPQILTVKGKGTVRITNSYSQTAQILIIAY